VIATGSVRRQAQLAYLRPDLQFIGLRGNIPTRIAKAADVDAVLVAVAGATWVGLADRLTEILELDTMVPQVGQGAMAIECRTDDASSISACVAIEDAVTRRCVDAERAFLARLGGGCDLPVGAHARVVDGRLDVVGVIAAFDGSELYRSADVGDDPSVGTRLAERLSAQAGHLLSD
jgi:hydroxymethylbilane synthase